MKISKYGAPGDAKGEAPQTTTTVGGREIVLSVRPNVGVPNYENHPLFVKPG